MLRKSFLRNEDFFIIKKTKVLGILKISKLLLEYLTKQSVNRATDEISNILNIEYIKGIIE